MLPPITDDHLSDLRMTGVNLAVVIGASVGAVVFVAIVIAVVIYCSCKRGPTDSAPTDPALPASVITTTDGVQVQSGNFAPPPQYHEVQVQPGSFVPPPQYHGVQVQPGSFASPPPYQTKA